MKVHDLIIELNKSIKCFENTRVDDFSDFHTQIKEKISEVFSKNNLDLFKCTPWRIGFNYSLGGYTFLKLKIDLTEDKRCKNRRKGRVNSLEFDFDIEDENDGFKCYNMSIDEFLKYQTKSRKKEQLDTINARIAEKEEELAEFYEAKAKYEEELKNM